MLAVILVLIGYLVGAIPTGYLVCRALGVDLRTVGSGNIGTANAYRAAGKKAFVATLVGDLLKGLAPVVFARLLTDNDWVVAAVALAALIGHCWPVYLGFKGGKAVATAAGTSIGLAPPVGLLMFVVWWAVVLVSRYTSLAALVLAVIGPLLFIVTGQPVAYLVYAACACILIVERHKGNVKALLNGTERKFGASKSGTSRTSKTSKSPAGKG
ncbi:glycerol-3-phosphate 1-O-acyltransferase PlsY [Rubrobacter aplysinae]|uniref:glycerol-3-phosphate 1-O-acyltransferase PlsY n=1 Tax=Rubrobacter aplysinae TaxID=909625 RepID=UPI00064BBAB6|nr:glycerol-3-phosphate 1-O-acyltransferase PlsY [Rubrobacter aplysinae]